MTPLNTGLSQSSKSTIRRVQFEIPVKSYYTESVWLVSKKISAIWRFPHFHYLEVSVRRGFTVQRLIWCTSILSVKSVHISY